MNSGCHPARIRDSHGTACHDVSVSRPLVIAHRGASSALPEHTRAAYVQALADGADGLECDVRMTADGQLVCLHDRTLDRTGGAPGVVSTSSLAQLRDVHWGAWRQQVDDPPPRVEGDGSLLTLRELVELALDAPRPVGLAIETKHPTRAGGRVEHAVARVLRDYGLTHPPAPGRPWARMMSFSPLAVRRMSRLLPALPTVQLVADGPATMPRPGVTRGAGTVGLDIGLVRRRPRLVEDERRAGREVFVWTVDTVDDLDLCRRLRVDAVITNRPKAALDAMAGCG